MKRLRIGICRPSDQSQVTDYVLSVFTKEELREIRTVTVDALEFMLRHIQVREHIKHDLVATVDKDELDLDDILWRG